MRRLLTVTAAAVLTASLLNDVTWAQQPNAEQRQQITEANKLKGQVSSQMMGRKYEEATKTLGQLEEAIKKFPEQAGIARFGKPEEIANLMSYLVSPAAKWITGASVRMDGGEIKGV